MSASATTCSIGNRPPLAAKRYAASGLSLHPKQDRHLAAETEVLRPLAHVEFQRRLAFALLQRRQLQHQVIDALPAQFARPRLVRGNDGAQPTPVLGFV